MNKYSTPIKYGIIGALVSCITSFTAYMFYRQLFSSFVSQMLVGIIIFGIGVFIPVWGGVTFRAERGGVLSFKDAFLGVFIICALSFAGSGLMTYIIPNIIDPDYAPKLMEMVETTTRESMEKFGAPDDKIEEAMGRFKIENFKPDALGALKSYGGSLIWGAILSLIIAAFIRRRADTNAGPVTDMGASS